MRLPFPPLLLAALAAFADASAQRCFEDAMPLVSNRKPIRFFKNNWQGHELATTVAAILVREKLGFPTEALDRAAVTELLGKEMETGEAEQLRLLHENVLDVNMELWTTAGEEEYAKLVGNGGHTGGIGREAIYVPAYMVNGSDLDLSCPVGTASGSTGSGRPTAAECAPDMFYAWWQTLTDSTKTVAFRRPETTAADLGHFFGPDESWVTIAAFFRRLMIGLDLKLEYHPAGAEWGTTRQQQFKAAIARKEPIIFFHYSPHAIHHQEELVEVQFPSCSLVDKEEEYSAGTCGYPDSILHKAYNLRLEQEAPDVAYYIRKSKLSSPDQEAMLAQVEMGASMFDVACSFLKANPDVWQRTLRSLPPGGCPPGHFANGQSCIQCRENTYNAETGQTSCRDCPPNTATNFKLGALAKEECVCKPGFYQVNGSCVECLQHGSCAGMHANPTCRPSGGFWLDSAKDESGFLKKDQHLFRKCALGACLGGENCSCARGHWGPICQSCVKTYNGHNESYFKRGSAVASCLPCPTNIEQSTYLLEIILLWTPLISCAVYLVAMCMVKAGSASDEMAVVFRYFQLVSLVCHFQFKWPAWFFTSFDPFMVAVRFDLLSFSVPLECAERQTVSAVFAMRLCVLPWLVLFFTAFFFLWRCCFLIRCRTPCIRGEVRRQNSRAGHDADLATEAKESMQVKSTVLLPSGSQRKHVTDRAAGRSAVQRAVQDLKDAGTCTESEKQINELRNAHIQGVIHVVVLLYVFHCEAFLSYFDCVLLQQDGKMHWKEDLVTICYEGEHLEAMVYAVVGLIIYVIGTPLLFFVIVVVGRMAEFPFDYAGSNFLTRQLEKKLGATEKVRRQCVTPFFRSLDNEHIGCMDKSEIVKMLGKCCGSLSQKQQSAMVDDLLSVCTPSDSLTESDVLKYLRRNDQWRSFDERWKPVWDTFNPNYAYWFCVISAQTVVIVCCRIWWADDPRFAGTIALYWCIGFFCLQILLGPYESRAGNASANVAALSIVLILLGVLSIDDYNIGSSGSNLPSADDYKRHWIEWLTVLALVVGGLIVTVTAATELFLSAKDDLVASVRQSVLHIPLFADCEESFLSMCKKKMVSLKAKSGTTLCTLGDIGEECWALNSGEVDCIDDMGNVHSSLVATKEVTHTFGELALLDDAPRKFTIIAKTDCELTMLTRKDLTACFLSHEGAENTVCSALNKFYPDRQARLESTMQAATVDALIEISIHDCTTVQTQISRDAARNELRRRTATVNPGQQPEAC